MAGGPTETGASDIPDEEWQEDRQVFDRDHEEQIYVTEEAKKHWSDKNPKKFNPDTALKIIQYVGAGCFIETAAAAAGISKQTLYTWLRKGESHSADGSTEELRAWKQRMDEAEALAEARAVMGIQEAGAQQWTAYAWFLERKYPQRWRAKTSVINENPDGTPVQPPPVQIQFVDGPGDNPHAVPVPPSDPDKDKTPKP